VAKNFYDITLALAGICQATQLTQQLAHQGQCDSAALQVSIRSLLDLNPASTLAVYGNDEANLRTGLETLMAVLNSLPKPSLIQKYSIFKLQQKIFLWLSRVLI